MPNNIYSDFVNEAYYSLVSGNVEGSGNDTLAFIIVALMDLALMEIQISQADYIWAFPFDAYEGLNEDEEYFKFYLMDISVDTKHALEKIMRPSYI